MCKVNGFENSFIYVSGIGRLDTLILEFECNLNEALFTLSPLGLQVECFLSTLLEVKYKEYV